LVEIAEALRAAINPAHIFTAKEMRKIKNLVSASRKNSKMSLWIVREFIHLRRNENIVACYPVLGLDTVPEILENWAGIYCAMRRAKFRERHTDSVMSLLSTKDLSGNLDYRADLITDSPITESGAIFDSNPGYFELCCCAKGVLEQSAEWLAKGLRGIGKIQELLRRAPGFFQEVLLAKLGLEKILFPDARERRELEERYENARSADFSNVWLGQFYGFNRIV
jgi:hypothetical protein